jgi:hypothetical protein
MNYTKRTLVVLAGLTVLAASSQAQVNLTGFTSTTGDTATIATNEIDISPTQLDGIATGSASATGLFVATGTPGISNISVTDVTGSVFGGVLTLTVTDLTSGLVLYSDSTANSNPLKEMQLNTVSYGSSPQTIVYAATYTGPGYGYLGTFAVVFTPAGSTPPPPVPEPASFGVMGIGVVGLALRNRRRVK